MTVLVASEAVDNYIGLALSIVLLALLIGVLVFPERF